MDFKNVQMVWLALFTATLCTVICLVDMSSLQECANTKSSHCLVPAYGMMYLISATQKLQDV
jgi:hypothetical protein